MHDPHTVSARAVFAAACVIAFVPVLGLLVLHGAFGMLTPVAWLEPAPARLVPALVLWLLWPLLFVPYRAWLLRVMMTAGSWSLLVLLLASLALLLWGSASVPGSLPIAVLGWVLLLLVGFALLGGLAVVPRAARSAAFMLVSAMMASLVTLAVFIVSVLAIAVVTLLGVWFAEYAWGLRDTLAIARDAEGVWLLALVGAPSVLAGFVLVRAYRSFLFGLEDGVLIEASVIGLAYALGFLPLGASLALGGPGTPAWFALALDGVPVGVGAGLLLLPLSAVVFGAWSVTRQARLRLRAARV